MPTRRQVLAGIGTSGVVGMAGCLSEPSRSYQGGSENATEWWPQPQYDAYGTCFNPETSVSSDSSSVRWKREISPPAARPIVTDGIAVFPTSRAVRGVSVVDGSEQWSVTGTDQTLWPRSVAAHGGVVFISRSDSPELIAVDVQSGTRQWKRSLEEPPTAFTISQLGEHLYAGDSSGTVYSFDPATGTTNWKRKLFGPVSAIVSKIRHCLVGTQGGELYALFGEDGNGDWRRKFPEAISALGSINGSYTGSGAFVSCFGGPTYSISVDGVGSTTWKKGVWSSESFVINGSQLFTAGNSVRAINYRNSNTIWSSGSTTQCGPAGAGDLVFVGTETSIDAYTMGGGTGFGGIRFGAKQWSQPVEGRPEQGIAVADGAVFVMTMGIDGDRSMAYAIE